MNGIDTAIVSLCTLLVFTYTLLQLFRSELDDCDGDSEGESEDLSIVPSEMTRPIYLGSSVTVLGATILPIFLSLTNLPPHLRMLKRNIVTCLFWVAKSKPPMPLFLGYFNEMIQKVNSTRLTVKTPDGIKMFYLKPLFGVFDMVAKAPVLNMHQFNDKNGCPSCLLRHILLE